jgi:hypothetical protein
VSANEGAFVAAMTRCRINIGQIAVRDVIEIPAHQKRRRLLKRAASSDLFKSASTNFESRAVDNWCVTKGSSLKGFDAPGNHHEAVLSGS